MPLNIQTSAIERRWPAHNFKSTPEGAGWTHENRPQRGVPRVRELCLSTVAVERLSHHEILHCSQIRLGVLLLFRFIFVVRSGPKTLSYVCENSVARFRSHPRNRRNPNAIIFFNFIVLLFYFLCKLGFFDVIAWRLELALHFVRRKMEVIIADPTLHIAPCTNKHGDNMNYSINQVALLSARNETLR